MKEPTLAPEEPPHLDDRGLLIFRPQVTMDPQTGQLLDIRPPADLSYSDQRDYAAWCHKMAERQRLLESAAGEAVDQPPTTGA